MPEGALHNHFLSTGHVTHHDSEQCQREHGEKDGKAVGVQLPAGRHHRLVLVGEVECPRVH